MTNIDTSIAADAIQGLDWMERVRTLEDKLNAEPGDLDSFVALRNMRLGAGRSL
jgi:hypothetical protein